MKTIKLLLVLLLLAVPVQAQTTYTLTGQTGATLDALLGVLDVDSDGSFVDETWYLNFWNVTLATQTANTFFAGPTTGAAAAPTYRVMVAADIPNDLINSQHYAAGSIDNEHMAADSIDSDQYVDGSIDNIHLAADSVNSDNYVNGSIDLEHLSTDSVDYTKTTGSFKSLTPVISGANNFAANFTGANLYGGTFIANAAGTAVLPAPAAGMNFTYILEAANENIIDPLGTDTIVMNGLAAAADENILSSTLGAICVFQYRAANSWMATCTGFVEATPP